jgi:bifunctional non-homologous end joining protein LigD
MDARVLISETWYKALRARLTPLIIRKTQPYSKRIAIRGIWVEPELREDLE